MPNNNTTHEPNVSIIILNFNGGQHVLNCIESIHKTTNNFEVILIDNNSTDNSENICKNRFSNIILIRNPTNEGMSARNLGLKSANGKYIVFLDSDTIVTENWVENFVRSFENHGTGLYGPKFLKIGKENEIDSAGNMINIFGLAYARGKGETDKGNYDDFTEINYPAGACVFSSSKVFQQVGEVDKIFFAYHDDVDYGWRAALLGIPSYYEPKVTIYHLSSPTLKWSRRKFFLLERNRWICLLSLYSTKTIIKILPFLFLIEVGISSYFLINKMGLLKLEVFFSIIGMLPQIRRRKKNIDKKRKVDDKTVVEKFTDDFLMPTYATDKSTSTFTNAFVQKLSRSAKKII